MVHQQIKGHVQVMYSIANEHCYVQLDEVKSVGHLYKLVLEVYSGLCQNYSAV